MNSSKFELNRKAIDELAKSDELQAVLIAEASKIASQLGEGYEAEEGNKTDRVRARVVQTDEKLSYKELFQGGAATDFIAKNGVPE